MMNFAKRLPSRWKHLGTACLAVATCLMTAANQTASAQHALITGSEPPGLTAQKMILSQPHLAGYPQPVELVVPQDVKVRLAQEGSFGNDYRGSVKATLPIGAVYRYELSEFPEALNLPEGTRLYPTLEPINRLYPPEGEAERFPVQVILTPEDLREAARGKMVTKVIYLEDPDTALPIRHPERDQPTLDVLASEDPLHVAERMGRPMVIVRVGTRIPSEVDLAAEASYQYTPPQVIEDDLLDETAKRDPVIHQRAPARVQKTSYPRNR